MNDKIELYCGDCLEIMENIQDKSVDLVLCDLPYGVLNKSNPYSKWDSTIDLKKLWEQYMRITKPNAAIVLFGQGMFTAKLMMSNPKYWRYNLIWDKGCVSGFLNAKRQPMRQHEDIVVFSSGQTVYNPQMEYMPENRNHKIGNGEHAQKNRCYGNFSRVINPIISDYKYPKSIIHIAKEHKCNGKDHPNQKPVELMEYLIKTYSNEGDLVLDNTMGSGSTGIACVNTGRRFKGIELNKEWYDIARERINLANIL